MPGKIFLSCGQASEEERKVAKEIKDWLEDPTQGFKVYIAIEAQSINDINNEIIQNLEDSDYFIFIDFKREQVIKPNGKEIFRGSLFTNQELALAYWLDFEKALFLQQEGIELEGMSRYLLSNAEKFVELNEILAKVKTQIKKREWTPSYSRHLVATSIESSNMVIGYSDHVGSYNQWVWFARVKNKRQHVPAMDTVARLINLKDPSGVNTCRDRAILKWAGQKGYRRLIMPNEEEWFSAFALSPVNPLQIYMHSTADLAPRHPINGRFASDWIPGTYFLHYQVISARFPILEFEVELNLTGELKTTQAHLVKN